MSSVRADYYVYALFRETGVPFYIGKGRGRRWQVHDWQASAGEKLARHRVIRSIRKRGLEIPRVKLHEGLSEATANEYEVALIAALGREDQGLGSLANLTDGGDGISGHKHSAETTKKFAATHRSLGRKLTPEHRAILSASRTGRTISAENRAKMGAALSLAMRGKRKTAEHRAKIAAAHRGKRGATHTPEAKAKIAAAVTARHHLRRAAAGQAELPRGEPLAVSPD